MVWTIEFAATAENELSKLDKSAAKRILKFLKERVATDPRSSGKALRGDYARLWRYRIGDYRVICEIRDQTVSVLVVRIGHRKEVYR
ncbi:MULTISPECIES: type II toxin-antitoxin system RelE family toxin [Prosthecochloris]|uniref:Type II toxin-antitoxin system RelE/ParE family toxin n=1 Tax=Prosthecochloris vibrioformis TaxID=1098 RepID=A0A5C4S0L2_PROVB|nr:type II toxin-antitoxin system RelE/ParE family toxin [Prosthecochloris vibrioformis]TNJ36738.1 type II toxin-antitoxin system RelE/ParE family toxin [Prosthecochloris vibrioformis]